MKHFFLTELTTVWKEVTVTGSHQCVYSVRYVLEELCDVFSAAFGPHPGIGVVVERWGHHMLLNLNPILFTLITVIMGHIEPAEHNVQTSATRSLDL